MEFDIVLSYALLQTKNGQSTCGTPIGKGFTASHREEVYTVSEKIPKKAWNLGVARWEGARRAI